jgi:hypothetical protein
MEDQKASKKMGSPGADGYPAHVAGQEHAKPARVDQQRNDSVVCCVTNSRNAFGGISGACLQHLQLAYVDA